MIQAVAEGATAGDRPPPVSAPVTAASGVLWTSALGAAQAESLQASSPPATRPTARDGRSAHPSSQDAAAPITQIAGPVTSEVPNKHKVFHGAASVLPPALLVRKHDQRQGFAPASVPVDLTGGANASLPMVRAGGAVASVDVGSSAKPADEPVAATVSVATIKPAVTEIPAGPLTASTGGPDVNKKIDAPPGPVSVSSAPSAMVAGSASLAPLPGLGDAPTVPNNPQVAASNNAGHASPSTGAPITVHLQVAARVAAAPPTPGAVGQVVKPNVPTASVAGAITGVTGAHATPFASANATPAVAAQTVLADNVPATPSGLAATISAMHQTGQMSAILRLDPPGMGALSVHIAVGHGAQVNVQFIPAVAQTAQIIAQGMDDLRAAMSAAGLSLGQAQVGAGGAGGSGGSSAGGQPRHPQNGAPASDITAVSSPAGVRAYA